MQNKYAKPCAKCRGIVQPYKGVLEKVGNQWLVEHFECHSPTANQRVELDMGTAAAQPSDHPAFAPMDAFDWMDMDFEFHSH